MARYTYDRSGRLRSISKSDKDIAEEGKQTLQLVLIAASLWPIGYGAIKLFTYTHNAGFHTLVSSLVVAGFLGLAYVFFKISVARFFYLCFTSLANGFVVASLCYAKFDLAWSIAWGVVASSICLYFAVKLFRGDFDSRKR